MPSNVGDHPPGMAENDVDAISASFAIVYMIWAFTQHAREITDHGLIVHVATELSWNSQGEKWCPTGSFAFLFELKYVGEVEVLPGPEVSDEGFHMLSSFVRSPSFR